MHVLVVEDEFIIADEIAAMVESIGHTVIGPVGTLDEAVAIIADRSPDFAIIDANLRGQSSSPLAERLKELDIPFCVCTGYGADDIRSQFGDIPVVQKPIRERALTAILGPAST